MHTTGRHQTLGFRWITNGTPTSVGICCFSNDNSIPLESALTYSPPLRYCRNRFGIAIFGIAIAYNLRSIYGIAIKLLLE